MHRKCFHAASPFMLIVNLINMIKLEDMSSIKVNVRSVFKYNGYRYLLIKFYNYVTR